MKPNMGTVDKAIRIIIALLIGVLYWTGQISGIAVIILGVLAIVFVLTSLISFCPLYLRFNISTRPKD